MRHIFANRRKRHRPSRTRPGFRSISAALVLILGGMTTAWAQDGTRQRQTADGTRSPLEARGLLRAVSRIDLGTALRARAKEIPFRIGERFAKGDTLIAFDCERYQAEEAAARAGADAAGIDYNSKKRLLKYGAIGRDEVTLAGALASKAAAELAVNEAVSGECAIIAPFSGRIAALNIMPNEYPPPDLPLMSIIDDSTLEIELVVPSVWLRWLSPGRTFSFTVEETGRTIETSIDRIGAEVDPVSQTVVIYAGVDKGKTGAKAGGTEDILAGMSGTASFHGGS